jgi:MSHA biogenesis protein MshK
MADRLMLAPAIVAAAALALSAGSAAQALTDPTRPPLELMRAAAADGATGAAKGAEPRPRVESILMSSTRKGAIINGQYVPLGGTYGKASLVKITATEVTLKSDQGLEVLQLYPPMEKPSAASGAEGKPEKVVKRP